MKKYSVFVSSTYKDLIEERKEVIQALLELDCIPIGMELFPATDDDQWTLIKELIDECDYYILILGGRYGSLSKSGISYTQMEYEYAVSIGVPVISFLHKSPDLIISAKTEKGSDTILKLEDFRKLVSEKMIKTWGSPQELGSVVSRSLIKLIKTKPRTGWVKADKISSNDANLEILELKQKIYLLEEHLRSLENTNHEDLVQEDDLFNVNFAYKLEGKRDWQYDSIAITINMLFSKTCTIMIDEAKEEDYKTILNSYISHKLTAIEPTYKNVTVITDHFRSVLIQFKALGLIEKSLKKRSLKDIGTYWKLTERGDYLLTKLRAIKRTPKSPEE
jgi:hypothetical protein